MKVVICLLFAFVESKVIPFSVPANFGNTFYQNILRYYFLAYICTMNNTVVVSIKMSADERDAIGKRADKVKKNKNRFLRDTINKETGFKPK